jgi:hypothetical protein
MLQNDQKGSCCRANLTSDPWPKRDKGQGGLGGEGGEVLVEDTV